MQNYRWVILGAGPAGLTFANKLKENGENSFIVLERESEAGGLCRSKNVDGFLLDGFPRTTEQAKALDRILAGNGEEVTSVVSIMIPDTMIRERIHHRATIEGRADDARDETINNRIATYHSQTEPLIDYYLKAGKYNEIDGTGTIDDVREAIFSLMDRF